MDREFESLLYDKDVIDTHFRVQTNIFSCWGKNEKNRVGKIYIIVQLYAINLIEPSSQSKTSEASIIKLALDIIL